MYPTADPNPPQPQQQLPQQQPPTQQQFLVQQQPPANLTIRQQQQLYQLQQVQQQQPPQEIQWMPLPQGIPQCPPGLEYLTQLDQLLVHQQVELIECNIDLIICLMCWLCCVTYQGTTTNTVHLHRCTVL